MTGPRPSQFVAQVPAPELDDADLPFPQLLVEECCKLLSKAVRARLLYLPNNPNYGKSAEVYAAAFAPLWAHGSELVITIGEHAFQYGPLTVFKEEGGDSLPWLFFKDGIRELRFSPGFESDEAIRFLDLLVRARKAQPDEDDLLTLLWQAEFQYVRYRYVDIGFDGPSSLDYDPGDIQTRLSESWNEQQPGGAGGPGGYGGGMNVGGALSGGMGGVLGGGGYGGGGGGGVAGGDDGEPDAEGTYHIGGAGGDGPDGAGVGGAGVGGGIEGRSSGGGGSAPGMPNPSGIVNLADFDATLYFLDEREVDYLRDEIQKEYDRDHRTNLITMLLDIFELQTDPLVREEVCGLLDGYMLALLSGGQFRAVAYLLRESTVSVQRARELDVSHRTRLGTLADRLSDPETLSQLLQALDDAAELPPQDELTELFNQLKPSALRTVFSWLGRLGKPALRSLLESAAGVLASQNTAELVRLISSDDRGVALEATRRAGALKTAAAVAPLGKELAEGDGEVRLAATFALTEIGTPGAMQLLERMVDDPERDVRIAAARALSAKAYKPALARLEAAVKGKALRDRDLTEKSAMFEAYGAVAADAGIPLLDGLLNGKGFLGRREDPEIRACAAVALGRIGSAKSRESLQKASGDAKDEPMVRSAVNKALRPASPGAAS